MSRRTQKNVGIIGLGIIGSRVAENLRRRGFHVFVWNRTPRPFPNFVGARSEVADLCDFIQIFVSDDDALLETIEQIKRSLKPHHVVMAHSTVAPSTMRAAAEIVQRKGAHFLDAPFTGSKIAAQKGELVYYIGGEAGTFQRARPVLEASSKEIVEIGEVGQATTIKVATNMITATTVQAAAEALALVHSAGVAPEKFAAAMQGNGSNSGTLAMKLPNMISGNFEPHFSTKHMLKDVQIASRLARSHGLNFAATEAARDSLRTEMEQGRGNYDYASIVRAYFPDGIPKLEPASTADDQQDLEGLNESAAVEGANGATDKQTAEPEAPVQEEPTGAAAEPPATATAPETEVISSEAAAAESASADSDVAAIVEEEERELTPADTEPDVVDTDEEEHAPVENTDDAAPAAAEKEPAAEPEREIALAAVARSSATPENGEERRGFLSRVFGRSDS
jgi:3-hydroxyisobutyrate dehydrogenase-like beta-hydroxyacid dehydrogenase